MSSFLRVVVVLLPAWLAGCAGGSSGKPVWTSAPGVDVGAFSTFGWPEAGGDAPRTILESQIRNALRTELLERGYVESTHTPDFRVSHETEPVEVTSQSNPVRIGIGVGSWGGNTGGSVGTSVDVGGQGEVRLEHRITIRAVARSTNNEIWIGTTAALPQNAEARAVERAIAGVMAGFPRRGE